jgi:hypothetical protein
MKIIKIICLSLFACAKINAIGSSLEDPQQEEFARQEAQFQVDSARERGILDQMDPNEKITFISGLFGKVQGGELSLNDAGKFILIMKQQSNLQDNNDLIAAVVEANFDLTQMHCAQNGGSSDIRKLPGYLRSLGEEYSARADALDAKLNAN